MKRVLVLLAIVALVALAAVQVQATTITQDGISMQVVGDLNNTASTVKDGSGNYMGSVSYAYAIGTYEVTNAQYVAFLNAVGTAIVNSDHLYNSNDPDISLSGSTYTTSVGTSPVRYIVWQNEAYYANWLTNGMGTTAASFETGTYNVKSGTLVTSNMGGSPQVYDYSTRGAVAVGSWAVASDNEWFKAAYYSGSGSTYYTYGYGSNTAPTAGSPPGGATTANVSGGPGAPTAVGSYTSAVSPYGCYDMVGNISERLDSLVYNGNTRRMDAGSDYDDAASGAASGTFATFGGLVDENGYNDAGGFRVVEIIPEPGTIALLATGLIGLLCYAWRKRK